jgi:predicted DNA-binding protein (UPF0251 family)
MLSIMARPVVPRRVCCGLKTRGFRPIGHSACKADTLSIGLDELEAIRLADMEGLYQDAAAERMGVSRQTYARVLSRARHAVAACLVESKMLVVEAGPVVADTSRPAACPVHGGARRRGRTCHCPARCRGCRQDSADDRYSGSRGAPATHGNGGS